MRQPDKIFRLFVSPFDERRLIVAAIGGGVVVDRERLRAFAQAILDNYPEPSETRVVEV